MLQMKDSTYSSCTLLMRPDLGERTLMHASACRWLIERLDFQQTFIITAAIKAVSFAPLLVLLVMLEEGTCCFAFLSSWKRRHMEQTVLDAADPEANLALTEPLIEEIESDFEHHPASSANHANGELDHDSAVHVDRR